MNPMASPLLLASLSLAFFCSCQADLIDKVCGQAVNPSLCTQALRSDPRSRGADLRSLGQIIIKKANTATRYTMSVAKSVNNDTNKAIVDVCVQTFNDAISDLNDCSEFLKKFDKGSISILKARGSGALTNVATCDDEFGDSEPSELKKASKRAQDLIDILLVIADSL